LESSYYQRLTQGQKTPEQLIEESLEFLLAKEEPQQILREFNLRQIKQYFPDYESAIKN
jgi:hypothetical protein